MRVVLVTLIVSLITSISHAQELTIPCWWRPTDLSQPWIAPDIPCLEEVIHDRSAGELAFTALAAAPDNTLFAARPLAGQVWALRDTDGDQLPDSPFLIAEGLTLPNGLDFHAGALYVSGGAQLYRIPLNVDGTPGALETLVDDVPSGGGFWTGGIAVGDDGRLYVGTGAPCDVCEPSAEPERGAILSFASDGGDRRVIARGLRQPADLAFHNGTLYVTDSAREGLFETSDLDEINQLDPETTGVHFGWPYCVGMMRTLDVAGTDCSQTSAPLAALPTASTPLGIAYYDSDTIPSLTDTLLVALGGSYNRVDLRGYFVATIPQDGGTPRPLVPAPPQAVSGFSLDEINRRGSGIWPHRPLDVTVNAWGWIYISIGGGRILAIRPQSENPESYVPTFP